MSSKSKRPPKRMNQTQMMNRDLMVFLWGWVSVEHPDPARILAVKTEILNICESLRKGLVNETMIAQALEAEFDLLTDWVRRDRG